MALGDNDGQIDIHVSENVVSSSVLEVLPASERAARDTRFVGHETVRCARLDTLAPQFLASDDRIFLKFDVQGFEDKVLDGAANALARAVGIQIELSVVPLYRGAPTYEPMMQRLTGLGFQLWHILPGFQDEDTVRMLQFDAILMR